MSDRNSIETDLSAEEPTASADTGFDLTKPKTVADESSLKKFKIKDADGARNGESKPWRLATPVDWVAMGLTGVAGSGIVGVVVCVFADANAAAYPVLGSIATAAVGALTRYLWRR
jgi:hypothetical protein